MKHVKATDPRKRFIMTALKLKTGANKITVVTDHENGTFSGNCLKGNRSGYESLGVISVTASEAGLIEEVSVAQ